MVLGHDGISWGSDCGLWVTPFHGHLAQLVETPAHNRKDLGSIPRVSTKNYGLEAQSRPMRTSSYHKFYGGFALKLA